MARIKVPAQVPGQNGVYVVPDTGPGAGVLISAFFVLTTSAVVGSRGIKLVLRNKSGDVVIQYANPFLQADSIAEMYSYADTGVSFEDPGFGDFTQVSMPLTDLRGGDTINIEILGIQAGDQVSDWFLVIQGELDE